MTIKERSVALREAFPDAGTKKLSQIIGCSYNTVKFHINPRYRKKHLRRANVSSKERAAKHKFILVQFLGGQCSECGFRDCYSALEFHHRDPSTKIGRGVSDVLTGSFDKALEEAEKCVLLCGNCHQMLHEKENDLSSVQTGDTLGVKVGMGVQSMPT